MHTLGLWKQCPSFGAAKFGGGRYYTTSLCCRQHNASDLEYRAGGKIITRHADIDTVKLGREGRRFSCPVPSWAGYMV
jgi:hypothetical protein